MARSIPMHSCVLFVVGLLLLLACQAAGDGVAPSAADATAYYRTARMSADSCSEEDVMVYQNNAEHLPNGIPSYSVEIINVCAGCTVYNIHVSCGEFASTELVDPSQFQRVGFNDCLVKGGGPLGPSESVSFQYSNSFEYPLVVTSVACE